MYVYYVCIFTRWATLNSLSTVKWSVWCFATCLRVVFVYVHVGLLSAAPALLLMNLIN